MDRKWLFTLSLKQPQLLIYNVNFAQLRCCDNKMSWAAHKVNLRQSQWLKVSICINRTEKENKKNKKQTWWGLSFIIRRVIQKMKVSLESLYLWKDQVEQETLRTFFFTGTEVSLLHDFRASDRSTFLKKRDEHHTY